MMRYTCPCCGYVVFSEPPGSDEICPVCYWHEDLSGFESLYKATGPNHVSLYEGQRNYELIGASEPILIRVVQEAASLGADKDPKWRPIDVNVDKVLEIKAGDPLERIYYWLREI